MTSSELNLVNLPSDVIRNIINFGEEAIDNFRLISPRWNSLTLEYLANPVIKQLVWTPHELYLCKMRIRISRRLEYYFRVANWEIYETEATGNADETTRVFQRMKINSKQNELNRLRGLFSRCERIEQLKLDGQIDSIYAIQDSLGSVIVDELNISELLGMGLESRYLALDFICVHSVQHLIFRYLGDKLDSNETRYLIEFLSEATSMGCIAQIFVFNKPNSELTISEHRDAWETIMEEVSQTTNITATFKTNKDSFCMTVVKR